MCSQEILNLIRKINNNQQIQRYFGSFIDLLQMDSRKFNEFNVEEIAKCCLLANELRSNVTKHAQKEMNENGILDFNKSEFFNKVYVIQNLNFQ